MTIAHLKSRTTSDLSAFNANRLAEHSLLNVDDLSAVDPYAIEFTVGDAWSERYSEKNDRMFRIHAEAGLTLRPQGSVVIEVGQSIMVPANLFGIVVPTGSLFLDRGILMAAAKIEPAFEGKLRLRLVNTSERTIRFRIGDKLASGIFFDTAETFNVAPVRRTGHITDLGPGWKFRAKSWLAKHYLQVITWLLALIALGGGAVAAKIIF